MFGKLICSAALATCLALPLYAESTTQPVIFGAGATGTAVSGQVQGDDTADYTLMANAGQNMTVRMNTDNPSAYFNIYAPGDIPGESQALYIGSISGLSANLALPASGTYLIRTYLMPSAAREAQTARFALTIDIAGRTPQASDVASLNDAPDYWRVTGIEGRLNIRADASTTAAIAGTVAPDTVMRSAGCQDVDGRSWCRVQTVSGEAVEGWAASEFLSAAEAPAEAPQTAAPPAAQAAANTVAQPAAPAPAAPAAAPTPQPVPAQNAAAEGTPPAPAPAAPAGATPPQPAPAAPANAAAPADRPAISATRPPAAPPSKIPLGGVAPAAATSAATATATASASVSAAKPAPKPAQANAPSANATGTLPCSTALGVPTSACGYAVTRNGEGNATVMVTWAGGGNREIRFENGAPVPMNGLATERRGDLTVIEIGNERYEIPDAVINGG